jgi:ribulose-5-phosphate 4-epimerase/fuculose-1-phosphate aldolase
MVSKGFLEPLDLVLVDLRGRQLLGDRKLTSEIRLHLQLYRRRPDVAAVVHVHAPHALAFAAARRHLPRGVLAEFEWNLGEVPLVPWKMPGTWDFARSLDPWIETHDVFALENHGVVAAGADPFDAYYKVECVDAHARVALLAMAAGLDLQPLDEGQLATVIAAKVRAGLADQNAGDSHAQRLRAAVRPRHGARRVERRWAPWDRTFPQVTDEPKLSTAPPPRPEAAVALPDRPRVEALVRAALERKGLDPSRT